MTDQPSTQERDTAKSELVDAIKAKDKHRVAAVLRSRVLTQREEADAFVIAAGETASETAREHME